MSAATLVRREQAAHGRLHAKNVEEVTDYVDAGGGLRFAAPCQSHVVWSAEGLVSGHVLIDAALGSELFVGVSGVGGAGEATSAGWRRDPNQFVRVGEW
jgi:hypothetical protein